jgi:lipopolysaccharide exporter
MTVSLLASSAIAGCLVLGAPLWAGAWGLPGAAAAIRIFAIAQFGQSAAAVPLALLRRRLEFGRAAVLETTAIVAGMGLGVALAVRFHSAAALAAGQAGGAILLFIATALSTGHDLRPSFDRGEVRGITAFASQVSVLGLVSFLTLTLPSWFVARAFGATTLGFYSRARQMAELPADYAGTGIYRVIYPLYGRVRDSAVRTRTLLSEAVTLTTGIVWPVFALIAGASPLLIAVVLGPRWHSAASLLSLFCLAVSAAVPTGLLTNCAEALGWMRVIAVRQAVLLTCTVAILGAALLAGATVEGMLAGLAAAQWLTYGITLSPFVRSELVSRRVAGIEQGMHALIAAAAYGLAWLCTSLTGGFPSPVRLGCLAATVAAGLAILTIGRARFPAGRVLSRRLAQLAPAGRGRGQWRLRPSIR